ncbi:MAG: hypothetical protein QOH88_2735 [Verrucomicrobiota bacterium]|jgi:hypothetical protein
MRLFFEKSPRRRVSAVIMILLTLTISLSLFVRLTSRFTESRAAYQKVVGGSAGTSAVSAPAIGVHANYAQLPLSFEANGGRTNEEVKFLTRGRGYTIFLAATEAVFVLDDKAGSQSKSAPGKRAIDATVLDQPAGDSTPAAPLVLRLQFEGANSSPLISGKDELPGRVNSFIGNDPSHWQSNIPTFGRVQYDTLYRGVDLVYHGNQQRLEYDFVVQPGADYRQIALRYEGADKVQVDPATGDLLLLAGEAMLRQHKPVAYQEVNGRRKEIETSYAVVDAQRVRFEVGAYDPHQLLVIDPILSYASYLGGNDIDTGGSLAVDAAGNVYLAGTTRSINFPTANAFQGSFSGGTCSGAPCNDVFVTKINASGTALVYSSYLGGNNADIGRGIAVDPLGSVYVTGNTSSSDFPTVNPIQAGLSGTSDAFVTKLNAAGSALVYSTYLGGSGAENTFVCGIALDSSRNAYLTGQTSSTNFPTANAVQATFAGVRDAFLTKINAAGTAFIYSTYLGGSGADDGLDLVVDAAGSAYVTGRTGSSNFPTANAFQPAFAPGVAGAVQTFVTKFNAAGTALIYSTYLGGAGGSTSEAGLDITVDSAGNAYVTGQTAASNFPVSANAMQPNFGGSQDAFVTKLNASGSALLYSTYLGGSGFDFGSGIAVDSSGAAYVVGDAGSTNFPTASALQTTLSGTEDAFVAKLNPSGSALVFSTLLGGTGVDVGNEIALDAAGNIYITGFTASTNFPILGALQATNGGGQDAFVAKLRNLTSLANISTRLRVEPGDRTLFAGLIATGPQPKRVIIRAIGPTLTDFNVPGALTNPFLELFQGDTSIATNDDWKSSSQQAEIASSGFAPGKDAECAIIAILTPGVNYSAQVRGQALESGIAVVEVFDLQQGGPSILANISSRGIVGVDDNVMIAGVIIGPSAGQSLKVLVRALGPTLGDFDVKGFLADPTLDLVNSNGVVIRSNDSWQSTQGPQIAAAALAPKYDQEAALVETLTPGSYSAIVKGSGRTTGIGLVEVYNIP